MTDIAALVADNINIWTAAIERKSGAGRGGGKRIGLYGIERLRALILDLAVRGRLVPQDAGDEPASELLKRIAAERKDLFAKGKISKPKSLLKIERHDISAPETWAIARFGEIFSLEYGDNLPAPKRSGTGEYNVYGSNGVVGTHNSYRIEHPCVVVGRKGSAGALNLSMSPCWVTDVAYYCFPPADMDLHFQYILFQTLGLDVLGKGIKPGLNRNDANVLPVAIPPLAEQRRIVAKVDELMALCDALERESVDAIAAHQSLVEALLATLVNSADAADLARQWARLESHFDTLFITEASIDALKQTILELAVRGKLVKQDAEDGENRLPSFRQMSLSSDWDEKVFQHGRGLFNLPSGWKIAPLAQVASHIVDCPHTTPKWTESGELCVRTNQIKPRHLDLSQPNYVSTETYSDRIGRLEPLEGDILYIREGGILGVGCRIPAGIKLCLGQRSMLIRCHASLSSHYLEIVMNSPFIVDQAIYWITGGAAPRVNMSTVRGYPIPIPPLAEQRRIVAKVDALVALCDALKARLADAAQTQRHLADAITERAAA